MTCFSLPLCNSLSLASLCSTKYIFLPFFTPLLLLCHFPVATVTDAGWFYLFSRFLCHLRGVWLFSIILFQLFSTSLAPKLRAPSHSVSLWPDCSWSFFAIYFRGICIQQAAGFEDQKSPESSVAVSPWVFRGEGTESKCPWTVRVSWAGSYIYV